MTAGAQQALRRTMEIYSNTTRFALACNNSAKVIEPIQSRCALLRYGRLSDEQVLERLVRIAKAENVPYSPEGLEALIFSAEGDLRPGHQQFTSNFFWFRNGYPGKRLSCCDQPHPTVISGIIENCLKGSLDEALQQWMDSFLKDTLRLILSAPFFRVVKSFPSKTMTDSLQLEFIKVQETIFKNYILIYFLGYR